MAETDASDRKDGTERRVYMLPAGLLERLRAYQVSQGIASEAEAARRLLDAALQRRDTVADILNTLETKFAEERDLRVLASDVLSRHALVTGIIFNGSDVSFRLANGERGQISSTGKLYYAEPDTREDDWSIYKRKVAKPSDLDDEIPF